MTADEDGKIGSGDIEDDLTLVTVVLINRRISSIEEAQELTKNGESHIYERIDLLIGQLLTSFVLLLNSSIRTGDNISIGGSLHIVCGFKLNRSV